MACAPCPRCRAGLNKSRSGCANSDARHIQQSAEPASEEVEEEIAGGLTYLQNTGDQPGGCPTPPQREHSPYAPPAKTQRGRVTTPHAYVVWSARVCAVAPVDCDGRWYVWSSSPDELFLPLYIAVRCAASVYSSATPASSSSGGGMRRQSGTLPRTHVRTVVQRRGTSTAYCPYL